MGANSIALAALAIAILQGWLMVWQVNKAREAQDRESLADQRYRIFVQLNRLVQLYRGRANLNPADTDTEMLNARRELLNALAKPTIMDKAERSKYLIYISNTSVMEKKDTRNLLDETERLIFDLGDQLNRPLMDTIPSIMP